MIDYYVYVIFDEEGVPRYIGAGHGSGSQDRLRLWQQPSYWRKHVCQPVAQWLIKIGGPPELLRFLTDLTHEQAWAWEIGLIDLIGRQNMGTGPLLNMTLGGGGRSIDGPHIGDRPSDNPEYRLQKYGTSRDIGKRRAAQAHADWVARLGAGRISTA